MVNNKVLSIILGGGQGSRLYPLTQSRSKPAVPIAGKYRLVDIPISNCLNADIKRMFVLTQFNSASLNRHIKNTYQFSNFSKAFVDVLAAEQTPENKNWFQGTADAVRQSMHHFKRHEFDYALILSGDQLYQMDFNHMIDAHIASGAAISIATIPVSASDAPSFGILKSDQDGVITSFTEKPSLDKLAGWESDVSPEMQEQGKVYLASMGIYIFNRKLLFQLLKDESTVDFGKEIIPQNIGKHKTLSYQYEGYWTDIGTISSFYEANLALTHPLPQFNLYDNDRQIYTRPRFLPTSKIMGTTIRESTIADGCIIQAQRIEKSVIGIRSHIDDDATVINTYMMGSDYYETLQEVEETDNSMKMGIGKRSFVKNCIIDKNCRIGADVHIVGSDTLEDSDNEVYCVRSVIVVIKKNATVQDGFRLE
jgi:glucose-1-phosphate adenylyltransferase